MSNTTGSQTRIRTEIVSTRWSPDELARLNAIAEYAGCSRAEMLRRLVERSHGGVIHSRELVASIRGVGISINQLTRALSIGEPVKRNALEEVYAELLTAVIKLGA